MKDSNDILKQVRVLKLEGKTEDEIRADLSLRDAEQVEDALRSLSYMRVDTPAADVSNQKKYREQYSAAEKQMMAEKYTQARVENIVRKRRLGGYFTIMVYIGFVAYMVYTEGRSNFLLISLIGSPFLVAGLTAVLTSIGNTPVPHQKYRLWNKMFYLYPDRLLYKYSIFRYRQGLFIALHPLKGKAYSRSNPRGLSRRELVGEAFEHKMAANIMEAEIKNAEFIELYFSMKEPTGNKPLSVDR